MGKKSKRSKTLSGKGPTGAPKSSVSTTKPTLTKEPRHLTAAPQNGEIGPLQLAELDRSCAGGVDQHPLLCVYASTEQHITYVIRFLHQKRLWDMFNCPHLLFKSLSLHKPSSPLPIA